MDKKNKIPSKNFDDFRGTFYLPAAMYRAGDYLSKGTKRRAIAVGLVAGTSLVSQSFSEGTDWMSVWEAVKNTGLITSAVCVSAFVGGLAMKGKAQGRMDKDSLLEEATGANLTENMKKRFHEDHKKILWERVGKYEQQYYPKEIISCLEEEVSKNFNELVHLVNPLSEEIKGPVQNKDILMELLKKSRITERGFSLGFDYCFYNPLNQGLEAHQTGLNFMQFVEDFYDGGFMHSSGNKTYEVWSANPLIEESKDLARWDKKEEFKKLIQAKWVPTGEKMYNRITTAISFRRAFWDAQMHTKYGLNFSLENYLEDSSEVDNLIFRKVSERWNKEVGSQAVKDFHAGRRFVTGKTLHYDYEDAIRKMDKAQLPVFLNATNLRARLDPKYVTGILNGDSLRGDLSSLSSTKYYCQKVNLEAQIQSAEIILENLPKILNTLGYDTLQQRTKDSIAGVLMAYQKHTIPLITLGKYQKLTKVIKYGVNQRKRYHSALENVRTLQALTMIDAELTRHYLKSILTQ